MNVLNGIDAVTAARGRRGTRPSRTRSRVGAGLGAVLLLTAGISLNAEPAGALC